MNDYIRGMEFPKGHPFRERSEWAINSFHNDTHKVDGIIRWKTNNRIPPRELLDFWKYLKLTFPYVASCKKLEVETNRSLREYAKASSQRFSSKEELSEMRAALGEGTTIVDVITGKKIKL